MNRLFVTTVGAAVLLTSSLHAETLKGTIKADGSSTVFPITEAVAEEFGKLNKDVKVTVGISGTGGGFKKFCANETDFSNASRPIKEIEINLCKTNGVNYVELPVAYDALSIIVNKKNTWMKDITVAELKKIWEPAAQGTIMTWNQVRPEWPATPIKLFGPGVDSGTYDYFTEAVVGKEDLSRGDYTSSEDDNMIVQGVSRDEGALGFLGFAYYEENQNLLRGVPVNDDNESNGTGAVNPSAKAVIDGTYAPLSRPLFVYVKSDSLDRPEVKAFVDYYIKNAAMLTDEVGYVSLPSSIYTLAQRRLDARLAGSVFGGHGHKAGTTLESLYTTKG